MLVSDDAEAFARAVILSGSYMLYGTHLAAPGPEVFERVKYVTPNVSGRMDNLARRDPAAATGRTCGANCARWTERYRVVEAGLRGTPGLSLIERPAAEGFVGSSIQVLLDGWPAAEVADVVARCAARGVELKWFGAAEPAGFTSRYDTGAMLVPQALPRDRPGAGRACRHAAAADLSAWTTAR